MSALGGPLPSACVHACSCACGCLLSCLAVFDYCCLPVSSAGADPPCLPRPGPVLCSIARKRLCLPADRTAPMLSGPPSDVESAQLASEFKQAAYEAPHTAHNLQASAHT